MHMPGTEAEIVDAVRDAIASDGRLAIVGGGSKAGVGRAIDAPLLSLAGLAGVIDYDPAELVLTVRPGTPLDAVQRLVAAERQMLAFEPFDHGPLFGRAAGAATIGGVVAAGVAGSRRVSAGGARDHMLGLRAVSGRGEAFVGGAKVVKNVTGYDLPKLAAGSWGRLFAITELTLKVLPRPETSLTQVIAGLDPRQATAAMARAMGSQCEVAAAGHRPAAGNREALTAIRLEGVAPSVAARAAMARALLGDVGTVDTLDEAAADAFWRDLRTLAPLGDTRDLWRINVPPSGGAAVIAALAPAGADWLMDWAGGLVWLALDGNEALIRRAAEAAGGHAMLVRTRAGSDVPAFHPLAPGLAALETRVRRAFDPARVFETGRF